MTEDKPIAKPIIDDATREKMALMFSGEVYLPDDVDGFFDLQGAQRDLQLELNATPLTTLGAVPVGVRSTGCSVPATMGLRTSGVATMRGHAPCGRALRQLGSTGCAVRRTRMRQTA